MTEKSWGSTVLGWFIVQDEKSAPPESSEYVEMTDDPTATPSEPVPDPAQMFVTAPPPAKGGAVDFDAVYSAAGIDEEERSRVKRTMDLLRSLPEGTDPTVRKQIVQASLTAFGVPIDSIIEAAVSEIQALEGYIRTGANDTQKVAEEADKRIRMYEDEIRQLREVIQQRVDEQHSVTKLCNEKKLEVQQILEFFGQEAVGRVVKASPKLIEPTGSPAAT